jgi:glycogen debranching enzyme
MVEREENIQAVHDLATNLLVRNSRKKVVGGREHVYTSASPLYGDQFNWDTGFAAIALSHINPEIAQQQIESMLSRQRADGFIGVVNFWEKMGAAKRLFYSSYYDGNIPLISQPPVLSIAEEKIFAASGDTEALLRVLPKLAKNIDYFVDKRDPDADYLIAAIHPWELGIDLTPSGDQFLQFSSKHPGFLEAYRKMFNIFSVYKRLGWQEDKILASHTYNLENVMFNVIVAEASRSVARMYQKLGDTANYDKYWTIAENIKRAILDRCWDEQTGMFYDLDQNNQQIRVKTISSLAPLFLENLPNKYVDALVGHVHNPKEFWSQFPIPSVAMDEPTFHEKLSRVLWRGQTFVNTNWLISSGLRKNGHADEAAALDNKTIDMVVQKGPYEFFSPISGKGGGMKELAWDSLIIDMAEQLKQPNRKSG